MVRGGFEPSHLGLVHREERVSGTCMAVNHNDVVLQSGRPSRKRGRKREIEENRDKPEVLDRGGPEAPEAFLVLAQERNNVRLP